MCDSKYLNDMMDKGATVIDESGVRTTPLPVDGPPSWAKNHGTLDLLAMLDRDLEMLDTGEWEPDGNSVDASRDVVAEIVRRVKADTP